MFSGGILGTLDDAISLVGNIAGSIICSGDSALQNAKVAITSNPSEINNEALARIKGYWDHEYGCIKLEEGYLVEKICEDIIDLGNPNIIDFGFDCMIENIEKNIEKLSKCGGISKAFDNVLSGESKDGWVKMKLSGVAFWVDPTFASAMKKYIEMINIFLDETKLNEYTESVSSRISRRIKNGENIDKELFSNTMNKFKSVFPNVSEMFANAGSEDDTDKADTSEEQPTTYSYSESAGLEKMINEI